MNLTLHWLGFRAVVQQNESAGGSGNSWRYTGRQTKIGSPSQGVDIVPQKAKGFVSQGDVEAWGSIYRDQGI